MKVSIKCQTSILIAILSLLLSAVHAQLGPVVLSPEQNATVPAGGKMDIVYQYQNVGNGSYSVDIQLWQDAAATIPISDVVKDQEIKAGNSSGVKVNFYLNTTYSWNVPHGLNKTFWLTVTETAETKLYAKGISLRSRPVMLHTSAAKLHFTPTSMAYLLASSVCLLFIHSLV
ncbi:hypothetical protein A0J61_04540 [Choanephora cucurbitarum]|uniref:Translocon-associated protein subunit beta n=1 Tax=Choanephora cucurbitarum TaxID=101091 RepID=A0A1C7NFR8_9FUNG|nr:hypothetical protein A0J61_04540 [Choanephora cucurbitarum]